MSRFMQLTVQNHKDIQIKMIQNREKQQIPTIRTLNPINLWQFYYKTSNDSLITKNNS